jgi:hypothetical protein
LAAKTQRHEEEFDADFADYAGSLATDEHRLTGISLATKAPRCEENLTTDFTGTISVSGEL